MTKKLKILIYKIDWEIFKEIAKECGVQWEMQELVNGNYKGSITGSEIDLYQLFNLCGLRLIKILIDEH